MTKSTRTPEEAAKLREEVERLRREIAEKAAKISEQAEEIEDLKRQLSEAKRAGKRQATPFARRGNGRKRTRRKPGQAAGHAPASRPVPDRVDEEARAPLCGCPHCGGDVSDIKDHEQFVTDTPPVTPHTTRVVTQSGWCAKCRRRVRTTHPSQVSRASARLYT